MSYTDTRENVPERCSGLHPSENKFLEWHSGAFRQKIPLVKNRNSGVTMLDDIL
jgi:hypothetical protein